MKSNKYLYQVIYQDGTVYDQNVEDRSKQDPTKSCYFDINVNKVKYFTLSNGLDAYTLDLTDGGLAVNGSEKFYFTTEELHDFKLIHFRRVRLVKTEENEIKHVAYILGFTARDIEENMQTHTIIVV